VKKIATSKSRIYTRYFLIATSFALCSIPRGAPLHAGHVGVAIGRAALALALPQHLAQAVHGHVVRVVQRIEPRREQLHRLADAARLVYAALLADSQVHRKMQKGFVRSGASS